jgi:hypothetical protein
VKQGHPTVLTHIPFGQNSSLYPPKDSEHSFTLHYLISTGAKAGAFTHVDPLAQGEEWHKFCQVGLQQFHKLL